MVAEGPPSFLPFSRPLPSALPPRVLSTPSPPSVSLVFQTEEPNKEEFLWIHRVNCPGTEPHMANCQGAGGAAQGKLRPACPGGMHAVVSCVAGPHFLPSGCEARAQGVQGRGGSQGPACRPGAPRPHSQNPAVWGGTDWWEGTLQEIQGRRG